MKSRYLRLAWERKGIFGKALWVALLPLSFIYLLVAGLRNWLYSHRWIRSRAVTLPVISVGNLTVGGTGKTPTCLWLAQQLEQRGLKVGILSRGYKRTASRPLLVPANNASRASVAEAGDEPSMMARFYGKTVCVARHRYEAAKELLRHRQIDLFILDDGYQHRQLKRDVDLLILGPDAQGSVVPAGPFREPPGALRRADLYLVTGAEQEWAARLAGNGRVSYFTGELQPACLISYDSDRIKEYPLGMLDRRKIVTVAGIANADSFYSMIYDWGGELVETMEFPDHHVYDSRDWQRISRGARGADLIITTEKDILKLVTFPFAREKLFALRVAMHVQQGEILIDEILKRLGK
jgi:tetraacyldisaccharide 4'-kinase